MSSEIASIRPCADTDFDAMYAVINSAATAYAGVIPADCYHVPYMPLEELRDEIAAGVRFGGWYEADGACGVMGIQHVDDVTLIRHAYVRPSAKGRRRQPAPDAPPGAAAPAVARRYLGRRELGRPLLRAPPLPPGDQREKDRLLRRYWSHPRRQVDTSVVLGLAGG